MRRGYLDLTPAALLGRRYIVWGLSLAATTPLLTFCHVGNYLCQANWHGEISPLLALWPLFPWMLPIALAALGGLGTCLTGGVMLFAAPAHPPLN
jgi:hypothetical protein